jgi:Translation elongation factor P (EF-P)/translation initiation factor 5A (eIF-5A)
MQYLYSDGDLFYFMDNETFEQMPIGREKLGDSFKFVKENMMCKINSYKGNVFAVDPPMFVELEVTETEPGVRGDTATGASKPATLETGATIKVPLFINVGEMLRIDTRTGEYLERA